VDVAKLESRGESLAQVAEALGGFHVAFFGHVQGRYGNALLSKYPIASHRGVHLRGGTVVAHKGGEYRIHRGLLVAEIKVPTWTPQGTFTVACTHLDHIAEREREAQIDHIIEALEPHAGKNVVLLGDLNALTRSDYTQGHWHTLEKCNQAKGWAPPQAGCLARLERAGYKDSWTLPQAHPQNTNGTQTAGWTARRNGVGDRRIDYVWLGRSLLQRAGIDECRVADDIDGSDHFPLVVDISAAAARCPPAAL
jgi:endonuclease/exonuclease/phosphatase family metal-dependent hydrolase